MRKQFLAVLLSLLVVALITAAAQTQGAGAQASEHAALQSVNVVRTDDGVSVEIHAHGTVTPHLSTLDHPARVVVDLPNTVVATSRRLISVDNDGVKSVRLGMDGQTTPNTRIVVDLMQACQYELVPGSDSGLVLLSSLRTGPRIRLLGTLPHRQRSSLWHARSRPRESLPQDRKATCCPPPARLCSRLPRRSRQSTWRPSRRCRLSSSPLPQARNTRASRSR